MMANESEMTRAQQIRSEALEQAVRIACKHPRTVTEQVELSIDLAKTFEKWIKSGK